MIETIMLIVVIFVLSGVFWYSFFYQKEKRLFNRLQRMLDCAIDGELERTEISEEKYSALENSMKQYIDSSFLAKKKSTGTERSDTKTYFRYCASDTDSHFKSESPWRNTL